MPNITLKEAVVADVGEYLDFERKVYSKTYFGSKSEDKFLEKLGKGKIYLFQKDGKTIGHIAVIAGEGNSVYLRDFMIDPEYQGKGYARQAVEAVKEKVKDVSVFHAAVHPDNAKAIHLYEALGFKIIGRKENYCGDGEPRLILIMDGK